MTKIKQLRGKWLKKKITVCLRISSLVLIKRELPRLAWLLFL
jgi:hypothetical protein